MATYQTITAEQLKQLDLKDGIILDVRTTMEHGEKRLVCAHEHVPLDQLNPTEFMQRRGRDKAAAVYILCRSGGRARTAAEKFLAEGYSNVFVIEGGITACADCGHEVAGATAVTVPQTGCGLSLERQVRIAAGGLVALGALLGLISSPVYTLIPLAVGGGLVYAGITDKCGLALLLTKAPWNRGACCRPSHCATPTQEK